MAQSINDAVSNTVMTIVGIVAAAAIVGAVSFAWTTSASIAGIQTDIAVMKEQLVYLAHGHAHDRPDQPSNQ